MFLTLAQAAEQATPQGSILGMFLPMILVFGVFYFLLIRPQQKQQKKLQAMVEAMRPGDEVVTRSGLHGRITSIDGALCKVRIATNVDVTMGKDAIALVKNAETAKLADKKENVANS